MTAPSRPWPGEPPATPPRGFSPRASILLGALLALFLGGLPAASQDSRKDLKREAKRIEIDEMADDTLEYVLSRNATAKLLFDNSYGWAAFDNLKIQFAISGGGGQGVAIVRESGERTYMNMGTGGVGLGIGIQKYQVVFLFEDQRTFDSFVDKGWKAEASASATAGTDGVATGANFTNGMAVYQISEEGLMAGVDISGTRYWKDGDLN